MNQAQHTPGPWHFDGAEVHAKGSVQQRVVEFYSTADGSVSGEQIEANGRLIAAAPDLLAALEAGLPCLEYLADTGNEIANEAVALAIAAIKAARGE